MASLGKKSNLSDGKLGSISSVGFATERLAGLLQTEQMVSATHFLRFLQAGRQAGHAEEGAVLSDDVKQKSGQLPPG